VIKKRLHTPEAAACKNCFFFPCAGDSLLVIHDLGLGIDGPPDERKYY
jgi:hypothetical protein